MLILIKKRRSRKLEHFLVSLLALAAPASVFQTTAALTAGLDRIPDQLGYLVISEDGVLAVSVETTSKFWFHPGREAFRHSNIYL